ncbi:Conserved oligomeric Golgi complex subunit 2 like protein [Verticillium longisporum]|uniref:Conserved oligomeric Golgi complex subunit 2 n=1 Tax=Verticillium longisporum TaxID=100787 RepID=A0A8I3A0B3_VERLO|nr:Conserved oligomeric Golgi complex subunit 2 like protein [Verticillium longisporum]KAG7142032.1 Conserved oligomeric Golgi complex subunit 2 like protein [Verticillium longisporum]
MTGLGIKSPTAAFHMASSSSSTSSEDDDAPLPFPEALPRSDFLAADFDPASYLSNLPHRHQTLDDLKSDLRERSAAISAELLELVNSNYTAFLSLGDELRGGDDKVEDVKVAMLGFRRQIEEIKSRVRTRKDEAASLTGELGDVRKEIEMGRRMLELDDRVSALEEKLAVASMPGKVPAQDADDDDAWSVASSEDSDAEDDEVYTGLVGTSPSKLSALAHDYCIIEALADVAGRNTPFVAKIESRMMRCRNTLLLDLNAALKESRKAGDKGKPRLVKYLGLYGLLDAEAEAIKALKGN